MSGPEQAATVTPGQAAYEAWCGSFPGGYLPWNELDGELRAAWEAAGVAAADAHAMTGILTAVKADSGDTIAIAFNRPVSARMAHEVAERWKRYAPGVTLVLVDDVAAIGAREPAVVTAGTEHLAEKIRGLAIPDEEN